MERAERSAVQAGRPLSLCCCCEAISIPQGRPPRPFVVAHDCWAREAGLAHPHARSQMTVASPFPSRGRARSNGGAWSGGTVAPNPQGRIDRMQKVSPLAAAVLAGWAATSAARASADWAAAGWMFRRDPRGRLRWWVEAPVGRRACHWDRGTAPGIIPPAVVPRPSSLTHPHPPRAHQRPALACLALSCPTARSPAPCFHRASACGSQTRSPDTVGT